MALFKVSIKQSGQYNGCKVEKGMEVEVSYNGFSHNLTGTVQGQELIVAAFQQKYGMNGSVNTSWRNIIQTDFIIGIANLHRLFP